MGHFRANSCYFAPAVQAIQSLARTHKIHGFQTTRNINANGAHEFAVVSAVSLYYFNTNEPWYYCGLVFFKERMRGGPEKILKVFIFFFFFCWDYKRDTDLLLILPAQTQLPAPQVFLGCFLEFAHVFTNQSFCQLQVTMYFVSVYFLSPALVPWSLSPISKTT